MHAEPSAVLAAACANCGAPNSLQFCPGCGQKRPNAHEYSLGHLFHEFFHELFHVDGKIVRTLRTMVAAPGQLTVDYWEGRRARYLTPLRIYLVATAAYFAAVKVTGALDVADVARQLPAAAKLLTGLPPEALEVRFQLFYKSFLVLSVAGLALIFRVLLRERPYGAYLVAALHTLSVLFVITLISQKLEEVIRLLWPMPPGSLATLGILAYWPYLAKSMHRWSGQTWSWVMVRLVLTIVATLVIDGFVFVAAVAAAIATLLQA